MKPYEHTQTGYLSIIFAGFAAFFSAFILLYVGLPYWGLLAFAITGAMLAMFSTLTVSVDERELQIRYGIGIFRKRFPVEDLNECEVVRNPWWYGWGIRLTPRGWLYNVSGLDAVEILRKDGKTFRVGTDEPEHLKAALNRALGVAQRI